MGVETLLGKTLVRVDNAGDAVHFLTADGEHYRLYHEQDCCECVRVEDVCGDLADLVGSPLTMAEETVSGEHPPGREPDPYEDSFTWTFYRFATLKGYVTIRWLGTSNGYYSESVSFGKVD